MVETKSEVDDAPAGDGDHGEIDLPDLNLAVRGLAETVAANIRLELARSDASQRDVAEAIGKSRAAVYLRLKNRVPWTLWEVGVVAELLGMSPAHLVAGPPLPTPRWVW